MGAPDHLEQLKQQKRDVTRALVAVEEQAERRKRELTHVLVDIEEQIERHRLQQDLAHLTPEERRNLWQIIWGGRSGK